MIVMLKDGWKLVINEAKPRDAERVVTYMKQVVLETKNLAYEPDEFTMTIKQEKAFLTRVKKSIHECMLIGEVDSRIVSVAGIHGSPRRRLRHRVDLGISVLEQYHNQGIGRAMMESLFDKARELGKKTIELEVRSDNTGAIALYQKLGFIQEGTKKKRFFIDGHYIDNILMAKDLEEYE